MVKRYQAWGDPAFAHSYKPPGAVSNYLHSLRPGDSVLMRHNATAHVRLRYPFAAAGVARVTMICVGVGVAPMVQCLHHVFADAADPTEITLIYGNRSIADVLQREQLESWAAAHAPPRFRLVLVIGSRYANVRMHRDDCPPKCKLVHPPPAPLGWDAFAGPFERELGWVDEAVIRRHAHAPAPDTRVIVCGLPGVYDAICGPRKEALREGSYLANIGFTDAMVVKL
jgi:NAD(P)H-flavin reductase